MSPFKVLFPAALAVGLAGFPLISAGQEFSATITKDEANQYSCASQKRIPVIVRTSRELLPEERYQYALGGGMHVVCADHAGSPLPVGKKVKVSLSDSRALILP